MQVDLNLSSIHEKLENPSFEDLIDVFEDLWRHCIFSQVDLLLHTPDGDIAAMTILCSYFEAIAGYISGQDTNGRSREFFIKGFCLVFNSDSSDIEKMAAAVYKHIRCGLAHEGMLNHKVNYSRVGAKAFFLTYRRTSNGSLDIDAGVVSIVINPLRIYQSVLHHFDGYIRDLRESKNQLLMTTFQKTAERQWAIGKGENIIGMTEAEFLGNT